MSLENYESLLTEIEAIPDADAKAPYMPVEKYAQKATNLQVWSEEDIPKLTSVGVPQATFDALVPRAGALRYAQSIWMKDRHTREEARREWDKEHPIAIDLKNELEHGFRFAYRKHPDLLGKVQEIEAGSGKEDLVQDLSDLSVLGRANLELLMPVGITKAQLDEAANKSTQMSKLLADMIGENIVGNETKLLRDKAYILLKEAVDEILAAGKFVFWKDADRLKGYKSSYHSS